MSKERFETTPLIQEAQPKELSWSEYIQENKTPIILAGLAGTAILGLGSVFWGRGGEEELETSQDMQHIVNETAKFVGEAAAGVASAAATLAPIVNQMRQGVRVKIIDDEYVVPSTIPPENCKEFPEICVIIEACNATDTRIINPMMSHPNNTVFQVEKTIIALEDTRNSTLAQKGGLDYLDVYKNQQTFIALSFLSREPSKRRELLDGVSFLADTTREFSRELQDDGLRSNYDAIVAKSVEALKIAIETSDYSRPLEESFGYKVQGASLLAEAGEAILKGDQKKAYEIFRGMETLVVANVCTISSEIKDPNQGNNAAIRAEVEEEMGRWVQKLAETQLGLKVNINPSKFGAFLAGELSRGGESVPVGFSKMIRQLHEGYYARHGQPADCSRGSGPFGGPPPSECIPFRVVSSNDLFGPVFALPVEKGLATVWLQCPISASQQQCEDKRRGVYNILFAVGHNMTQHIPPGEMGHACDTSVIPICNLNKGNVGIFSWTKEANGTSMYPIRGENGVDGFWQNPQVKKALKDYGIEAPRVSKDRLHNTLNKLEKYGPNRSESAQNSAALIPFIVVESDSIIVPLQNLPTQRGRASISVECSFLWSAEKCAQESQQFYKVANKVGEEIANRYPVGSMGHACETQYLPTCYLKATQGVDIAGWIAVNNTYAYPDSRAVSEFWGNPEIKAALNRLDSLTEKPSAVVAKIGIQPEVQSQEQVAVAGAA